MLKSARLITMLCLSLMAVSVQAKVNMLALNDMSCAAWKASKDEPEQRATYTAWMLGFLTGYNYGEQKKQVSSMSSGTIENFTDRYCASNPTEKFSDAAFQMSDQFSGRNEPLKK